MNRSTTGWPGRAGWLAGALLLAGFGAAAAQIPPVPSASEPEVAPEGTPENAPEAPAAEDPTRTAGGALRLFMASRHYQTIRQLREVMTERLRARYDHDSAPFNGKRGNRIAGFDFSEKDLKPARGKASTASSTYIATVRSLWEEQGEATERRTESITLALQDSGLWRVADLSVGDSDKLRFADAVNGVTALRGVLRAWVRGDAAAARPAMTAALLKKIGDPGITALFTPAPGRRHGAFQIVDMTAKETAEATAHLRLYETVIDEPGPIDGQPRTARMIRKGQRWLLDGWD